MSVKSKRILATIGVAIVCPAIAIPIRPQPAMGAIDYKLAFRHRPVGANPPRQDEWARLARSRAEMNARRRPLPK